MGFCTKSTAIELATETTNFDSINEADADESTRIVFEDIKSTMGVALVNQVWRRFAVVPDVLQSSWQTLKPYYQDGSIIGEAWQLRQQLAPLPVDAISNDERDNLKSELTDVTVIDAVLRTYERGNAQNFIALCLLQDALISVDNPSQYKDSDVIKLSRVISATKPCAEQQADTLFSDIPELPRMESLSKEMQALVARSSLTWVPSKYAGLQPSVFRHLSYWPGLLLLFTDRLETIERHSVDNIDQSAARTLNVVKAKTTRFSVETASLRQLSTIDRLWLRQQLEVFIEVMLARGVVIVPTLRSLL